LRQEDRSKLTSLLVVTDVPSESHSYNVVEPSSGSLPAVPTELGADEQW
jgi:hypothetical protein